MQPKWIPISSSGHLQKWNLILISPFLVSSIIILSTPPLQSDGVWSSLSAPWSRGDGSWSKSNPGVLDWSLWWLGETGRCGWRRGPVEWLRNIGVFLQLLACINAPASLPIFCHWWLVAILITVISLSCFQEDDYIHSKGPSVNIFSTHDA